jgi:hypothetical protein
MRPAGLSPARCAVPAFGAASKPAVAIRVTTGCSGKCARASGGAYAAGLHHQGSSPRCVRARSDLGDSLKETAALDELIDALLAAKSQQQVRSRRQEPAAPPPATS